MYLKQSHLKRKDLGLSLVSVAQICKDFRKVGKKNSENMKELLRVEFKWEFHVCAVL